MKGKIFFSILGIAILLAIVYFVLQSFTKEETTQFNEYTPQEEINEEQARQTLVTLYFQNIETKDLMPEARLIDAKLLINNPCETLVKLLINGPKNDKLQTIIPKGTEVNKVTVVGNMAIVDFSTEFIRDIKLGAEEERKIINSIVYTLTELTEIDSVKILIDGHEGTAFDDKAVDFKEPFTKVN